MLFKQKVFEVVKNIPKGSVLTYKDVAIKSGRPRAFRAVGNILNTNYDTSIPCHRVIRSDGKLGGYNRGASSKKLKLLAEKGIEEHSRTSPRNVLRFPFPACYNFPHV